MNKETSSYSDDQISIHKCCRHCSDELFRVSVRDLIRICLVLYIDHLLCTSYIFYKSEEIVNALPFQATWFAWTFPNVGNEVFLE